MITLVQCVVTTIKKLVHAADPFPHSFTFSFLLLMQTLLHSMSRENYFIMTDPKQWSIEAAWESVKKRDNRLCDKKIVQILLEQLSEVKNKAVNKVYIDKATAYLSMWQVCRLL